jgi:glycosyltransferase involved in cell wall biosynthesis
MNAHSSITVLMPVYNCENYVAEAIDSVLNQTHRDFELLIVNDGSTDGTERIIRSYNDPRIRIITQANAGVSMALNAGLEKATGRYIARFDADDICYPERLGEQLRFMQAHPDHVMVGADAEYVTHDGQHIFDYESPGHTDEEIRERILERNPFIHSVLFFVKDAVLACGGYDPKAHTFEDHLLWVKLIRKGKVHNLRKPLIKVRLNPESVTTDERLRGKKFLSVRREILERGEQITDQEEQVLLGIIRKQNKMRIKKLGYHLFVMKKYLWNNHQPVAARKHIKAAIALQPFDPKLYAVLVFSFLPAGMINRIYKLLKK